MDGKNEEEKIMTNEEEEEGEKEKKTVRIKVSGGLVC